MILLHIYYVSGLVMSCGFLFYVDCLMAVTTTLRGKCYQQPHFPGEE